jgi:iron-sulfur cluster repair protein YtfE (RIC family)
MNKKARKAANGTALDATALLIADHENVKRLFKEYEQLAEQQAAPEEREALAAMICAELTIHARIEEEIFYPAIQEVLGDEEMLAEAVVEHSAAKDLIGQLADMSASEELFDAKVKVLGEQIEHHVEEEQGEMFPKVTASKLDTAELGRRLHLRRQELVSELDIPLVAL